MLRNRSSNMIVILLSLLDTSLDINQFAITHKTYDTTRSEFRLKMRVKDFPGKRSHTVRSYTHLK